MKMSIDIEEAQLRIEELSDYVKETGETLILLKNSQPYVLLTPAP